MHNYLEFFDQLPHSTLFFLMAAFGLMQGIGEVLEFMGVIVPEFMKLRKWFARRRKERETLSKMTDLMPSLEQVPDALKKTNALLQSVDNHYSHDNITMRDNWMKDVNSNIDEIHQWMQEMSSKIDRNNEDTLEIRIENMRDTIIDFASYVSKESNPVTREQYNRVFKLYDKYEVVLAENGRTNGEVDIAISIIKRSYEKHLTDFSFIEDSWNY